jgi:transposase
MVLELNLNQNLLLYVARNPDCQLNDYRRYLATERDIHLTISTIWRSLEKAGYSQKMVSSLHFDWALTDFTLDY